MIGQRLAQARKRAGLSQSKLAAALGCRYDHTVISRVERNLSSLRLDGVAKAARELDVSVDYLLGLTDDPTPAALLAKTGVAEPEVPYGEAPATDTESELQGIPVIEIAAAAGGGATVFDETPVGRLWFRQDWLRRQGLHAGRCTIIGVRGESMAPTLPDGCNVLVDRNRRALSPNRIYVIRTEEGLVVKRARRNPQGWWLMSDNPQWPPMALTQETDIIGEVRWMARTL